MIIFLDYVEVFGKPDPRTKDWNYFNSVVPVLFILTAYLYFSKQWGLEYMEFRRPLVLRNVFILYDCLQIFGCVYTTVWTFFIILKIDWRCGEINNSEEYKMEPLISAFYHFLKVVDLFETVFHVLNKRDDHLTFAHFYHHTMMVLLTWLTVRYAPGGHSMFLPFINGSINIVKYSAYLTTAYDKSKRRCTFWRNNNTQIQLVQFCVAFVIYLQPLIASGCSFPKGILVIGLLQVILLVIFSMYYYRSYYMDQTSNEDD